MGAFALLFATALATGRASASAPNATTGAPIKTLVVVDILLEGVVGGSVPGPELLGAASEWVTRNIMRNVSGVMLSGRRSKRIEVYRWSCPSGPGWAKSVKGKVLNKKTDKM